MAIRPGTEPLLDATRIWKERCLLRDGSILSDRTLWTRELFDELDKFYVQRPDLGEGRFLEKLEGQMDGASSDAYRLMTEVLWVIYLFPTNIGFKKKAENLRTVWEWSEEAFPADHEMIRLLRDCPGIGSGGQGLLTYQWAELSYLITAVQKLKGMTEEERRRLIDDPWRFAEWLEGFPEKGRRQMRHILRHLLFPETFEWIASSQDKAAIVKAYADELPESLGDGPAEVQEDRALFLLRETLQDRHTSGNVDFYAEPFVERWRPKEPPIRPPKLDSEKLADLRRAFLSVYPDFQSFETPPEGYATEERAYKDELAEEFARRFAEAPSADVIDSRVAARTVEDLLELLRRRLASASGPQNLLNWRQFDFLRHLKAEEKTTFAKAFLDLLLGEGSSPDRVERFNKAIWPILERTDEATPAISRSFPTLFLMLQDPDHDFFVRTDLANGVHKALTGKDLFETKPMDAGEYRKALGLAQAIRKALEGWGWAPQDMIDVQSFLWIAHILARKTDPAPKPDPSLGDPPVQVEDFSSLLQAIAAKGLYFPPELVSNYVIALQTKRFAILSGISGTGKTKLAQEVARLLGADPDDPSGPRYAVIPVRPDWTDNRGLLGYYNPLAETYVPTSFLLLLLRARREESEAKQEERPPKPYFVVLDEMNLARVEHYFSDFLSAMESDEPLELHHHGNVEITVEGEKWTVPARLKVPRTLFFTGTVNVDETTYMFSPKVLDRAFTLELNEVDLQAFGGDGSSGIGGSDGLLLDRVPVPLRAVDKPSEEDWRWLGGRHAGALRQAVEELNVLLAGSGRHFGYRVATEMARFVRLAVMQGANGDEDAWAALDLAMLQKVLPKFHGTQQEIEEPLRKVFAFALYGTAEDAEAHAEGPTSEWVLRGGRLAPTPEAPEGVEPRFPRTAAKTWRMLRQLPARGFTSFIE